MDPYVDHPRFWLCPCRRCADAWGVALRVAAGLRVASARVRLARVAVARAVREAVRAVARTVPLPPMRPARPAPRPVAEAPPPPPPPPRVAPSPPLPARACMSTSSERDYADVGPRGLLDRIWPFSASEDVPDFVFDSGPYEFGRERFADTAARHRARRVVATPRVLGRVATKRQAWAR